MMGELPPHREVILLNGPPQAGKDTIAKVMAEVLRRANWTCYFEKFAYPLEKALSEYSGIPMGTSQWQWLRETAKDEPVLANDLTPRKFMQEQSELAKRFWGEDVFGRLCANKVMNRVSENRLTYDRYKPCVVFITDSGFQAEYDAFCHRLSQCRDEFHSLSMNPVVMQIDRTGKSFEGDTREYVNSHEINHTFHFFNNEVETRMDILESLRQYFEYAKCNIQLPQSWEVLLETEINSADPILFAPITEEN